MEMRRQESSGEAGGMEHPELEDLAAYAEGKLAPAARERLAEHLDSCEDCFDIFAEVVRMTADDLEVSAESGGANPAPPPFERRNPAGGLQAPGAAHLAPRRPRRRFWYRAAAVAAVLLVTVGLGLTYRTLNRSEFSAAEWDPTAHGFSGHPWEEDVFRGGDDGADEIGRVTQEVFQIGVLDVDLQLTLRQKDLPRAAEVCRRIANLLDGALFMENEAAQFRELRSSLDAGQIPPGAHEKAAAALQDLPMDRLHLNFGRWAEVGRLWAAAGQQEIFAHRSYRRFLNRLLHDPASLAEPAEGEEVAVALDPAVQQQLQEIETILDRDGDLGRAELGRIERALAEVIRFYHPLY
jgi:hypothetical protein